MSIRGLALPLALAMCAPGLVACSDDDAATPGPPSTTTTATTTSITATTSTTTTSTTTTNVASSTTAAGPGGPSTAPLDDAAYAAAVAEASARLDAAGGDLCKTAAVAMGGRLPNPSTPTQVRTTIDYLERSYRELADALPPAEQATKTGLLTTITALHAEAEQHSYEPSYLTGATPQAFTATPFRDAVARLTALTKDCPDQ